MIVGPRHDRCPEPLGPGPSPPTGTCGRRPGALATGRLSARTSGSGPVPRRVRVSDDRTTRSRSSSRPSPRPPGLPILGRSVSFLRHGSAADPARRRRSPPSRLPGRPAARRRFRRDDRAERWRSPAPARRGVARPPDHRPPHARDGRAHARRPGQGAGRPADHRAQRHRHGRQQGRRPRTRGRGLHHETVPLPRAAGARDAGPAAPRRPRAPPGARPRTPPHPRPPPPRGDRRRTRRRAHADRGAPPVRVGGESGHRRLQRNAPDTRLVGYRARQPVVPVGHDPPVAQQDRGPGRTSGPPAHRAWRRIPARAGPRSRGDAGTTDRARLRPDQGGALMRSALARLPYRTRLTLAMVGAALVPLLALALALDALTAAMRGEADQRLTGAAKAVAAQLSDATLDAATAARVAGQIGLAVAVYDSEGALRGRSDTTLAAGVLPDPPPAAAHALVHRGGVTSVFATVTGTDGVREGYVELAALQAGPLSADLDVGTLLALVLGFGIALALLIGWVLARGMVRPLGSLSAAVSRLEAGHLDERLPVEGEDELAAVAASHNRLADALAARNRSLGLVLGATAELAPNRGLGGRLSDAPAAAAKAFGFTAVSVSLAGPESAPRPTVVEDHVPGEPWAFPTLLRAAGEPVGTLWTTIPPTREWAQADQDLLELFAIELAAAIRNAQLFGEVERLSETKSEFLRGVSHNLQTPLTTIRAIAGQLAEQAAARPDRRLAIIVELSERLSRLVDQLLTVSRLEAGTLRPKIEVFAPAPLVARAWESLGHGDDGVGGPGLGLSVGRGLVEAMGGRLWIAPTDGPGATLAFSLPAERIEAA